MVVVSPPTPPCLWKPFCTDTLPLGSIFVKILIVHLYSRMFHSQSGTVFVSRKFTFPWNHITVPVENTTKLYYMFVAVSAQDLSNVLRHLCDVHLFSAGPFKLWHFQYRSESEGRHSFSIFASYWFRSAYLGLDWFGNALSKAIEKPFWFEWSAHQKHLILWSNVRKNLFSNFLPTFYRRVFFAIAVAMHCLVIVVGRD